MNSARTFHHHILLLKYCRVHSSIRSSISATLAIRHKHNTNGIIEERKRLKMAVDIFRSISKCTKHHMMKIPKETEEI